MCMFSLHFAVAVLAFVIYEHVALWVSILLRISLDFHSSASAMHLIPSGHIDGRSSIDTDMTPQSRRAVGALTITL